MILSLIKYGDIMYAVSQTNLNKIVNFCYRGLHTCDSSNKKVSTEMLCHHIVPLDVRREIHLLLFMHKKTHSVHLLTNHK